MHALTAWMHFSHRVIAVEIGRNADALAWSGNARFYPALAVRERKSSGKAADDGTARLALRAS
jgi:hypothetical protein